MNPVSVRGGGTTLATLASLLEVVDRSERPVAVHRDREQLGLKLRPARGPVEVLVIDSVQQPTPN